MKARQLIEGASYGPEALKVMGAAFDAAWAEISHTFGSDPTVVEAARVLLAEAVLLVASDDSRDVEALKSEVLGVLEMKPQTPPPRNPHKRRR
jgi:hypothetical protein